MNLPILFTVTVAATYAFAGRYVKPDAVFAAVTAAKVPQMKGIVC